MQLVRSWPAYIPQDRTGYVVDAIERVHMTNHDYRPLFENASDDLLLLEWDVAVSKEDLVSFADAARDNPDRILVAPYRIYYEHMLDEPVWAHRSWGGEPVGMANPVGAQPVATGDPVCNLFGLGMIYLPLQLMKKCARSRWSNTIGDVQFSMWHYANVTQDVPIAWDVRPVHLNYAMEGVML